MRTRQKLAVSIGAATTALLVGSAALAQAPQPWIAGQPRFVEVLEPATPTPTVNVIVGAPAVTAAAGPSYWIWYDQADNWHIRITSQGTVHTFRGRIAGVSQPLASFTPTRPELQTQFRFTPRGASFLYATRDTADGFDFRPTGNDCVRFYLEYDGAPIPLSRIQIGAGGYAAPSQHFQICKGGASAVAPPVRGQQPGGVILPGTPAGPPQPAFVELPEPPQPGRMYRLGRNSWAQPRGMRAGTAPTYWIWLDAQGTWHLRTSAGPQGDTFRGRVVGQDGPLTAVTPSRTEFRDQIRLTGRGGVAFAFATQGATDGFDFRPSAGSCVRFNLDLADGPARRRVMVGGQEMRVTTPNFQLCSNVPQAVAPAPALAPAPAPAPVAVPRPAPVPYVR